MHLGLNGMDELSVLLEIRDLLHGLNAFAAFFAYVVLPCGLLGLFCWWVWRTFFRW